MIRYALACSEGHEFESWFASAESYDTLSASGRLSCPDCGGNSITKSMMAPGVRTSRAAAQAPPEPPADTSLTKPRTPREAALAALRKKIETESDYVGMEFAAEARAMHGGETPHRSIYGEANLEEARSLIEDGVPVAPLPFTPRSRAN